MITPEVSRLVNCNSETPEVNRLVNCNSDDDNSSMRCNAAILQIGAMSELGWEPPSETTAGGDQSEVLLLTLLEPEELAGGDSITLHAPASASSTLISLDTDVKMETRLAMREALLPPRRGGRHSRTAPNGGGRCGTCGELPSPEGTSCVCGNHVALDLDDGGGGDAVPAAPTQPDLPGADAEASPHGCMFCERTFVRRSDLKSHLNLHLGIKKSVCDVCGRQFSHMSNLYRHMRTHTGQFRTRLSRRKLRSVGWCGMRSFLVVGIYFRFPKLPH